MGFHAFYIQTTLSLYHRLTNFLVWNILEQKQINVNINHIFCCPGCETNNFLTQDLTSDTWQHTSCKDKGVSVSIHNLFVWLQLPLSDTIALANRTIAKRSQSPNKIIQIALWGAKISSIVSRLYLRQIIFKYSVLLDGLWWWLKNIFWLYYFIFQSTYYTTSESFLSDTTKHISC